MPWEPSDGTSPLQLPMKDMRQADKRPSSQQQGGLPFRGPTLWPCPSGSSRRVTLFCHHAARCLRTSTQSKVSSKGKAAGRVLYQPHRPSCSSLGLGFEASLSSTVIDWGHCCRPSSCLTCSIICSFLHSCFTQQTFLEHLLGARHCPR